MKWTHNDLMNDLAAHLRVPERMVWTDMQLGPSGSPRPDVFTMAKSYTKPRPIAYEIKISVADFRSDVTSGKWQSYLKYAGAVIFAVPAGLITKADIPARTGLMIRGENGWTTVKGPTLGVSEFPAEMMLKLLIDGADRAAVTYRKKHFSEYVKAKEIGAKFGDLVKDTLHRHEQVMHNIQNLEFEHSANKKRFEAELEGSKERRRKEIDREIGVINKALEDCATALGLPPNSRAFDVAQVLQDRLRAADVDHRVKSMRNLLARMQQWVADTTEEMTVAIQEPTPPAPWEAHLDG